MKLTIALTFLVVAGLQATAIDSQPGLPNSLTAETVAISLHPWWQPNHPDGSDAVWISYADTGYDGAVYQPNSIGPAVTILHDFFVDAAGTLNLKVWADNTALVFLDGDNLINQEHDGGPGFFPDAFGLYGVALAAGEHELAFEVFQGASLPNTHSNPFGLLYTGTVDSPVPEPAPFLFVGIGLAMMLGVVRRSG